MLTTYDLTARAIKSRVDTFSDRRLNDGDDEWRARELELRCAVAATANAIAVEFAGNDTAFDVTRFAETCGLFVSDGRDNYSDCHPGELTWERPRDTVVATPALILQREAETAEANTAYAAAAQVVKPSEAAKQTDPERCAPDHELQADLPEYKGWRSTYEYPGFINYSHPDSAVVVCAASDFNGDAKLDIQIHTADFGKSFNDGENAPWPHEDRTAEKMFARIRPYLDKYHPTVTTAATSSSKES